MSRARPASARLDWAPRGLAREGSAAARRWLPLALAAALLAALAVAALRVDLIRVRYGLADALREEKTLLEARRVALADLRAGRDPAQLARLAAERGFEHPARIVELPAAPERGDRP